MAIASPKQLLIRSFLFEASILAAWSMLFEIRRRLSAKPPEF